MSKKQNVAELAATGQAVEVKAPRSREEKFDIVLAHLSKLGHARFKSPRFIEWTPRFLFRFRKTDGTSLEPVVTALREAGEEVEPNFDSLRHALQVSPKSLHSLACACNHGDEISAVQLAQDFEPAKNWKPFS